jgi:hypothetical protein
MVGIIIKSLTKLVLALEHRVPTPPPFPPSSKRRQAGKNHLN